jgi:hypothetical protein
MTVHLPTHPDLLGFADPLIGLHVQLDRAVPCHGNVAEICPGCGPHAYALLCTTCGRHLGWLPKAAADFVAETIRVFGIPQQPLILRPPSTPTTGGSQ